MADHIKAFLFEQAKMNAPVILIGSIIIAWYLYRRPPPGGAAFVCESGLPVRSDSDDALDMIYPNKRQRIGD